MGQHAETLMTSYACCSVFEYYHWSYGAHEYIVLKSHSGRRPVVSNDGRGRKGSHERSRYDFFSFTQLNRVSNGTIYQQSLHIDCIAR